MEANHLMALGKVHQLAGDLEAAADAFAATRRLARRITYPQREMLALQGLAEVGRLTGSPDAEGWYRAALEQAIELGDPTLVAACTAGLAKVAAPLDPATAARLMGATDRLLADVGAVLMRSFEGADYPAATAAVRAELGGSRFDRLRREGWSGGLDAALADVEELFGPGAA
jgi:hypothetical protein